MTFLVCSACKAEKPLSEFFRSTRRKRGYTYECKACLSVKDRKVENRFSNSRARARQDGIEWKLSLEDYKALVTRRCIYCSVSLLGYTGRGIDRIDTSQGYQAGNVAPCCGLCNQVKGIAFTTDEMMALGRVIRRLRERRQLEGEEEFPLRKRHKTKKACQ